MQRPTMISKGRKRIFLIIISSIVVITVFFIWLCNFSSMFVIGRARQTHQRNPVWSSDGKYIAFECGYSYPSDGWDTYSFDNPNWGERTSEICVFDTTTGETKRITDGRYKSQPIWSLDGATLAWFDASPNGATNSFVVYDIQSWKETKINLENTSCSKWWIADVEFVWTDAGQSIMSRCHELTLDLKSMKLIPATKQQLDLYGYSYSKTVKSPDGKYSSSLVEPSTQGDSSKFQGYDLIINQDDRLLFESRFKVFAGLSWTADSKILIFKRITDLAKRKYEIVFLYLPTKEVAVLQYDDSNYDNFLISSRNILAFVSETELNIVELHFSIDPFAISVSRGPSFRISGSVDDNFAWSPDGRFIYYTSSKILERLDSGAFIVAPDKIWIIDWEYASEPRLMDDFYQSNEQ